MRFFWPQLLQVLIAGIGISYRLDDVIDYRLQTSLSAPTIADRELVARIGREQPGN